MRRLVFLLVFMCMTHQINAEEGSADPNGDGVVDVKDFELFAKQFGLNSTNPKFIPDIRASDVLPMLQRLHAQQESFGVLKIAQCRVTGFVGHIRGSAIVVEFQLEYEEIRRAFGIEKGDAQNFFFIAVQVGGGDGRLAVLSHFATDWSYPASVESLGLVYQACDRCSFSYAMGAW